MVVLLVVLVLFLPVFSYDKPYADPSQHDIRITLTKEDFERAALLPVDAPHDEQGLYRLDRLEGDILTHRSRAWSNGLNRNAVRNKTRRWVNGRIPYVLDSTFSERDRQAVAKGMSEVMTKTCILFVPKEKRHTDYLQVLNYDGCASWVGVTGGAQELNLGPGCNYAGIAIHEFMHAIGFYHEQARNDRDDYVDIFIENMIENAESQFVKESLFTIDHLGTQYDYQSVMHYGTRAFTKNGKPTILPKNRTIMIGQRDGLSSNDAWKINILYQCQGTVIPPTPPAPVCEDRQWCTRMNTRAFCDRFTLKCPHSCGAC